MTHEKLLELLREVRQAIRPIHTLDEATGTYRWFHDKLCQRIDAALAEPAPSAEPVVGPVEHDGFWKDETYRKVVDRNHILVQSEGVDRWHWSVSHESNGMTYARGRAASLAEAKKAALEAVKARK